MRALPLEYPKDKICRAYPYEYLFGEALLVAPVMEAGVSIWPVYLPEGEWRDIWNAEIHSGPAVIQVDVPRDRIPVFQKKGCILRSIWINQVNWAARLETKLIAFRNSPCWFSLGKKPKVLSPRQRILS